MLTAVTLALATAFWFFLTVLATVFVRLAMSSRVGKHFIPSAESRDYLCTTLPAYLISTLHALYVTPRGILHLRRLFFASIPLKLHNPSPPPTLPPDSLFIPEIERVMFTNLILAGYLLCDFLHVLIKFPRLGGLDTALHHIAFFFCALVAGLYQLYPFSFGWLIVGEASTIFLNVRWFLIKADYGHTTLLKLSQLCFAIVFFVTRFALYGLGLAYHLLIIRFMPTYIPFWAAWSTTGFVVVGFILNMTWLSKIIRMARKPAKRVHNPVPANTPQTPDTAVTDAPTTPSSSAERTKAE